MEVTRPQRNAFRFAVAVFAAMLSLAVWAFASPVGSSPDENYHIASVWCGGGFAEGVCEPGSTETSRLVPPALLAVECYAYHPEASAACQPPGLSVSGPMVETTRGDFSGDYPPLFYGTMHLFVSGDVQASVILMRLFNSALLVLALLASWLVLPRGLSGAGVWGAVATLVPLGMFIVPSINPSSWAFTSATLVFPSVAGFMTAGTRQDQLLAATLATIGVLIGAGARADAAVYAVIAIVAALITTFTWGRRWLLRIIFPGLLSVVALAFFLMSGQAAHGTSGFGTDPNASSSWSRLYQLLVNVPSLWVGALGQWGLGWLDTPLPAIVWVCSSTVWVVTVFVALPGAGRRQKIAVSMLVVAVWAIPARTLLISGADVGQEVQPRYLLPLLVVIAVAALSRLGDRPLQLARTHRYAFTALAAVANAVALHTNLRRYLTGTDVPALNLNYAVEWWWQGPIAPAAAWAIGSLAFGVAVLATSTCLGPGEPRSDRLAAGGPVLNPPAEATDPPQPAK